MHHLEFIPAGLETFARDGVRGEEDREGGLSRCRGMYELGAKRAKHQEAEHAWQGLPAVEGSLWKCNLGR